jgi:hypothetical protein|tara:strand:+ start:1265 stop:1498 length:234 start_codon:yes stop_codon:yes gene_type:complete
MDIQDFFKLLEHHDWYYNYSDDHRAWKKGQEESQRIQSIIQEVPLYTTMYLAMSDYMFKPLDERTGLEKPKLEDYLN